MKTKTRRLTFSLVLVVSWLSHEIHAEGGCPPGQVPQQGNGWQACIPADGVRGSVRAPEPVWESRWQAIATDSLEPILGTAVDRPTRETAERDALIDCASKNGTACEIRISTGNGCVSMVIGKSFLATGEGVTKSAAELKAMSECSKAGLTCTPYYSACSLPVRIQ